MRKFRLIFADDKSPVYFRRFSFFVGKNKRFVSKVQTPILLRVFCQFRLFVRLLRLEPRCVEMIDRETLVFCLLHKVWVLNLETGEMKILFEASDGFSDPLNFCKVGNSVYWGDYGNNAERKEVGVYHVDSSLKVKCVYKFPHNSIRHVHNIVFDGESRQFWIMTGDNDKKAGIYRADCDFSRVEPINIGEQRYRAVVAFPYKDGIIYATDSVEDENHLYVCESDNDYVVRQLTPINGSCIYGTETKDYYVFSTTVEPPEGRGIRALFSNKLGGGIKSRDVHLVTVAKRDLSDIRIVAKYRKDWLPMKLFQYGAVMFPSGQYRNEDLLISPVACKGVDGESIRITL